MGGARSAPHVRDTRPPIGAQDVSKARGPETGIRRPDGRCATRTPAAKLIPADGVETGTTRLRAGRTRRRRGRIGGPGEHPLREPGPRSSAASAAA